MGSGAPLTVVDFPDVQRGRTGSVSIARRPYSEPVVRHDLGRMEHTCPKCGALHWLDERVQKAGSTTLHPLFGMCCSDGNIRLPAPPPPPEPIKQLFSASTPEAQHFRQNIRQYNSALAFTSLGAQVDDGVNRGGGGPSVFKIHGEQHPKIGSLLPSDERTPVYTQLYTIDSRAVQNHRMQRNGGQT